MIDDMQLPIIACDPKSDFKITFLNKEMKETASLVEDHLSVSVDELKGAGIEAIHSDLGNAKSVLEDAENLPWSTDLEIGDQSFHVKASAIYNNDGEYALPC